MKYFIHKMFWVRCGISMILLAIAGQLFRPEQQLQAYALVVIANVLGWLTGRIEQHLGVYD